MPDKTNWRQALYLSKLRALCGASPIGEDEDDRSSDWVYWVSCKKGSSALVVGIGGGNLLFRMHGMGIKVYAVDKSQRNITHAEIRAEARGASDIRFGGFTDQGEIPFLERRFDTVVLREYDLPYGDFQSFESVCKLAHKILEKDGHAVFFVENALSPMNLFRNSLKSGLPRKSLMEYGHCLRSAGFRSVEHFAPLPTGFGVPLFMVPLHKNALIFFFTTLFTLFSTASTEVKKKYGWRYKAAIMASAVMQLLQCTWLFRFFCPEYMLIARKIDP